MKCKIKHLIFMILLSLVLTTCQSIGTQTMINPEPQSFYVGTYTDGNSEGIYKYTLYPSGRMELLGLAVEAENPSFLTFSPDRKYLVSINEVKNDDGVGGVESYLISGDKLNLINRQSSGGAHPCFVTTNQEGFVLTANYTGGNVGLLRLEDEGSLSELLHVQQHEGQGGTDRQEGPHAHSAWFKPGGNEVISVDLGTNELWFSTLDQDSAKLTLSEPAKLAMEAGAGPRMLAFHPNGQWIYIVNELNSSVTLLRQTPEFYETVDSFSALPESFVESNTCAHILISSDGRFVYVSNRGHNTIAVFEVQETGTLKLLGHKATGGTGPRHFTFSPDEKLLLVANQHSNNIVSMKRNVKTGLLKYANQIEAHTPVCLVF